MKCKKCGAEVKTGNVYCSKCGAEIQIVPDYNAFDDDISNGIRQVQESNAGKENTKATGQTGTKNVSKMESCDKKKKNSWDKKKKALVVSLVIVCVVALILGISLFFTNRQKQNSFAYQYERAQEYLDNDLPKKALGCVDQALSLKENDEKALLLKADILKKMGKKKEMVSTLEKVIKIYTNDFEAYSALIDYYASEQDYAAIQKLMKGVKDEKVLSLFEGYVPEKPAFKQEPGEYDDTLMLEIISDAESQILYTLDGSSPTESGINYTQEIPLDEGTITVKAVATNEFGVFSDVLEGVYTIKPSTPDKPQVSLASGTYTEKKQISIMVPDGCTAYYTWDGTTPNEGSNRYSGSFAMKEGNNILSVVLVNQSHQCSDVARFNYIYYPEGSEEEEE